MIWGRGGGGEHERRGGGTCPQDILRPSTSPPTSHGEALRRNEARHPFQAAGPRVRRSQAVSGLQGEILDAQLDCFGRASPYVASGPKHEASAGDPRRTDGRGCAPYLPGSYGHG